MSAHKQPLRTRIVVSFALVGAVLSTLFALSTFAAAAFVEREFVRATVADELEYFVEQVAENPTAAPPESTRFRGWHAAGDDREAIPHWLRDLSPGLHEIEHDGTWYEVAIEDRGERRFFLAYDETEVERIKDMLLLVLAAGVLGVTFVAVWLGASVADRIVAPVTRLARLVQAERPDGGEELASHFAEDEVGALARAFDHHDRRVRELVRREQELTADTSHELRNGLAVIVNTAELLREAPELSAGSRERLARIVRAAAGLGRLSGAYLLLARDPGSSTGTCDAGSTLAEMIDRQRERAARRGCRLSLRRDAEVALPVPPEVLTIVAGNLIDNAIVHGGGGAVAVTLAADGLTVRDEGPGIPAEDLPHVFERAYRGRATGAEGTGLGLSIARRLAEHFGWSLTLESAPGQGTLARLTWGPAPHRRPVPQPH